MLPARPVFPLGFKAIRLQLFQSLFIRFPFARFPFRVYFGSLLKLWCCFRHFNYNTPNKSEAAFVIESHALDRPLTRKVVIATTGTQSIQLQLHQRFRTCRRLAVE